MYVCSQVAQSGDAVLNSKSVLSPAVARHLASAYGDHAFEVLKLAASRRLTAPLLPCHPYLEAEVVYCCQQEYCMTVEDFIARRTRLAFLDTAACRQAIPRVRVIRLAGFGKTYFGSFVFCG